MDNQSKAKIAGGFYRREPEAIQWVYRTYQPELLLRVRKITGDSSESVDLVNDAFVVLLSESYRFQSIREIRNFLHRIAHNISVNYLKRFRNINMDYDHLNELSPFTEEDFESSYAIAVFRNLVYRSIENLPPKLKRIYTLYYYGQLSNEEISQEMGISGKTVANIKTMAEKKLKKQIHKRFGHTYFILILIP